MDEPWWVADESPEERRFDARMLMVVCIATFGVLFGFFALVSWWSTSALREGATSQANYVFSGTIRDAATGEPIPFAIIEDDPRENAAHFRAETKYDGVFRLETYGLQHHVTVSAAGYRPVVLAIGRAWYMWWPKSGEQRNVALSPR